jgi:alkaline phosphatase D
MAIKVGEVTADSAIIWTRLTDAPRPGDDVEGLAVPGHDGAVRVEYYPVGDPLATRTTSWAQVTADDDHVHQFRLTALSPGSLYRVVAHSRGPDGGRGEAVTGSFRTAPPAWDPARVVFTVVTGQQFQHQDSPDGFRAYDSMRALGPSFFVHTGDIVYYDKPGPMATSIALARHHWHRTYSLPSLVRFHRRVPSYFIKDDHDTYADDCWPGMTREDMGEMSFEAGLEIFREQVPMGDSTYRTVRWGKDLQVWLVEGRDFRSPNPEPDGPDKTIWGGAQLHWLKKTMAQSDATFKVLISPTPIVGPDRESKRDNHSNPNFSYEGDHIRHWLRANVPEAVVVCGDRHWQYASVHPETGLREFSCGPISDVHAGGFGGFVEGWHRYFNLTGGFLSVTVERVAGRPVMTFRHHDVMGRPLNTAVVQGDLGG